MNLELILAFIVGAIIGGGITFKLLPGFLKSIFRETARNELSEIQNQISDDLIHSGQRRSQTLGSKVRLQKNH